MIVGVKWSTCGKYIIWWTNLICACDTMQGAGGYGDHPLALQCCNLHWERKIDFNNVNRSQQECEKSVKFKARFCKYLFWNECFQCFQIWFGEIENLSLKRKRSGAAHLHQVFNHSMLLWLRKRIRKRPCKRPLRRIRRFWFILKTNLDTTTWFISQTKVVMRIIKKAMNWKGFLSFIKFSWSP